MDEYIKREDAINAIKQYAIDAYDIDLGCAEQFAGSRSEERFCEGLFEAIEVLDEVPSTDVVPRSEVDKVRLLAYESGKREVAREIRTALLKEIIEARNSNFEAIRERETKHNVNRYEDTFSYYCDGKIHALDGIFYFIDEFLKKYEENK